MGMATDEKMRHSRTAILGFHMRTLPVSLDGIVRCVAGAARIFRQRRDGDWKGVFEDIEAALYDLVGQADQVGVPCPHFGRT